MTIFHCNKGIKLRFLKLCSEILIDEMTESLGSASKESRAYREDWVEDKMKQDWFCVETHPASGDDGRVLSAGPIQPLLATCGHAALLRAWD